MPATRVPLEDRFWPKVNRVGPGGCWIWTAHITKAGYGRIGIKRDERHASELAHRIAYELSVGTIPEGLELDHLCGVRACVNPAHLEPVSHRENVLRGRHPYIAFHHAGVCHDGHSLSDAYRNSQGGRQCRACTARRRREYAARVRNRRASS